MCKKWYMLVYVCLSVCSKFNQFKLFFISLTL